MRRHGPLGIHGNIRHDADHRVRPPPGCEQLPDGIRAGIELVGQPLADDHAVGRAHPVARVTIAGGPAKMTKLAEGKLDLHSKRGAVDFPALAARARKAGVPASLTPSIAEANSALRAFELAADAGFDLPSTVAEGAWRTAAQTIAGAPIELEILVVGRDGRVLASSGFRAV